MTSSANTTRTGIGGRAVSLAALAAMLVVLSSADAAMRVSPNGVRDAMQARPLPRASIAGLGRLVEGLLACATVPDEGRAVAPVGVVIFVARPAQVGWALLPVFGLDLLTDLPPPPAIA